ncbi:MAG: LolA family protein [Chitinophagaceae bacterium]
MLIKSDPAEESFIINRSYNYKKEIIVWVVLFSCFVARSQAQTAEVLIAKVKAKIDKVNDYEANGIMKTNVAFIKAPVAKVKVYFKKPNKLRIKNESGISFIPNGSVNINYGNIFADPGDYDIINAGKENNTGLLIIKLLPKDENAAVVLSILYIDEKQLLVKKSKTTTKQNGTYELEMQYGKYAEYGLADKIVFSFNTKDYKLPKGVTFDYDDGSRKQPGADKSKNKNGKVEISYSNYVINKGIPDTAF